MKTQRIKAVTFIAALLLMTLLSGCEPQPDPEKEKLKRELQNAQENNSTLVFLLVIAGAVGLYLFATRKTIRNTIVRPNVVQTTTVVRTPAHELVADSFVIDGLNVIHGSQDGQIPSLLFLLTALVTLGKRNCTFKCYFDANTYYVLRDAGRKDDARAYRALLREFGTVFMEARGNKADPHILDFAHKHGTPIISNDYYREFYTPYPWLVESDGRPNKQRLIPFIVNSEMIQVLSIGINEPLLSDLESALTNLRAILSSQTPRAA